jgi:hypothetical protein
VDARIKSGQSRVMLFETDFPANMPISTPLNMGMQQGAGARDWPYSSFRCWVRLGVYPEDCASDPGVQSYLFEKR